MENVDGVLLVDKDPEMTSHDVVSVARKTLGQKKIGHCGTLDPMATGLLILTLGRGTKIQDLLMACLLYTSPSPRDYAASRMPSSA